jgi:hypothetical protein
MAPLIDDMGEYSRALLLSLQADMHSPLMYDYVHLTEIVKACGEGSAPVFVRNVHHYSASFHSGEHLKSGNAFHSFMYINSHYSILMRSSFMPRLSNKAL